MEYDLDVGHSYDRTDVAIEQWRRIGRKSEHLAAVQVSMRLLRIADLLTTEIERTFQTLGLSNKGDYDTLVALRRAQRPLKPTEISDLLRVSSAGTTNRLDRLERAGYLVREPDPNDRRGALVQLTAAGQALIDAATERSFDRQVEIFGMLTKDEHNALVATLRRLALELGDRSPGPDLID